jgi:hypothetical protein
MPGGYLAGRRDVLWAFEHLAYVGGAREFRWRAACASRMGAPRGSALRPCSPQAAIRAAAAGRERCGDRVALRLAEAYSRPSSEGARFLLA